MTIIFSDTFWRLTRVQNFANRRNFGTLFFLILFNIFQFLDSIYWMVRVLFLTCVIIKLTCVTWNHQSVTSFTLSFNCWFSLDVTKFQTSELMILLRFYFHDVCEQLKTNIHTNFHSEWVLGLVIDYAWIFKLLPDVAFTWRARELWCWFKRWLISGNSAIWTVLVSE